MWLIDALPPCPPVALPAFRLASATKKSTCLSPMPNSTKSTALQYICRALPTCLLFCVLTQTACAMEADTVKRFEKIIAEVNAEETRSRSEYHAYLQKQGDFEHTLQEHIDRYGSFAKFDNPASESALRQIRRLSSMPFPSDLISFYHRHGGFRGGDRLHQLTLYQPEFLIERAGDQRRYYRLHSLGLIDMIRFAWGNDRPEFEPGSDRAIMTDKEIAYLNNNYIVVGYWNDPEWGEEAQHFIFFDRNGRFGTLYVHQDEFEIFHLLKDSTANLTWDEVMNKALDAVLTDHSG